MKSSRNERFSEHLLNVDEEILTGAYEIDDAEKLRQYIKTKNAKTGKPFYMTPVFRRAAAIAACFALLVSVVYTISVLYPQRKDHSPDHNLHGEVVPPWLKDENEHQTVHDISVDTSNNDTLDVNDLKEKIKVEVYHEYIPLLYANGRGGADDTDTEKYSGKEFFSAEKYEKAITEKRIVSISGSAQSVTYDWTLRSGELSYELDEYSFVKGYESVFVSYRTDTNKIVKYQKKKANNREYKSAVDPYSSEADYIAYAKAVLLEHAGVSVDDWEVKIQTWRSEYGYDDGFINYVHEIPAYNAEYIITFSKKISGIERCDKMFVHVTNVGEIIEMNAVNYDESFSPYVNIQIDKTKIEEAAWRAFNNIRKDHSIVSEKIQSIELITQDDVLWAQVTIEYCLGETEGGVQYAFEVARLK